MVQVTVNAPARLHLGFFDLNGGLGRRYGSIGIAIEDIATCVTVSSPGTQIDSPSEHVKQRASAARKAICEHLEIATSFAINVKEYIPSHAGLGSGTQWALAIGRAVCELSHRGLRTAEIAAANGRGARSGIGISVFDQGGFVVDLGRGANTVVPPPLCRLDFPANWPIILITEGNCEGISGIDEKTAFRELSPMQSSLADKLCRHTLMGIIPAVMEQDYAAFVHSLTAIQHGIGDYFAPFQGGSRFTSSTVAGVAQQILEEWPQVGIGQSSWGPTGFVVCPSMAVAKEIETAFNNRQFGKPSDTLSLNVHVARNHGAIIQHT